MLKSAIKTTYLLAEEWYILFLLNWLLWRVPFYLWDAKGNLGSFGNSYCVPDHSTHQCSWVAWYWTVKHGLVIIDVSFLHMVTMEMNKNPEPGHSGDCKYLLIKLMNVSWLLCEDYFEMQLYFRVLNLNCGRYLCWAFWKSIKSSISTLITWKKKKQLFYQVHWAFLRVFLTITQINPTYLNICFIVNIKFGI